MTGDEIREFLGRMEVKDFEVKNVQFPFLVPPALTGRLKVGIDYLGEIIVTVEAELGQAVMKIKDILSLHEGSVIKLEKAAGETAEVLVNHQRFGRGEVMVIGSNFGIRIDTICDSGEYRRDEYNE